MPVALVVDADDSVPLLVRKALEPAGFRVESAATASAAIEWTRRVRPDVVFLGIELLGVDPIEDCSALRRLPNTDNVPVLVLTSPGDLEAISRAYDLGATDFVHKPLNDTVVLHRVRYLLRASRTLQELQRSESRLAQAQRTARVGSWEWDVRSEVLTASDEFYRLTALDPDALLTLNSLLERVHPEEKALVRLSLDEALHEGKPVDLNHRLLLANGEQIFVRHQCQVAIEPQNGPVMLTGTLQDISELKQFEDRIHHLAFYDGLTDLPNRTLFNDRVGQAVAYAQRHGLNLVIMFIDIDRFKRINDTLGHTIGDMLLREVSARIHEAVRLSDSVGRMRHESNSMARLGGDEFTVLLPNVKYVQDAARVAQRVIESMAQPFVLDGHEIAVTASVGIAVYPMDGADAETLLKHADTAMYHAKEQGRNSYQFYSRGMNTAAFERLVLENDVRRALENDQFALFYQPKIEVASGRIAGAEALVRWRHPDMGVILPGAFLQVATEAGFMASIDEWVIREACRQVRKWQSEGVPPASIAMNISNELFQRRDLLSVIMSALEDTGVSPKLLDLEFTEGIILKDADRGIEKLAALKELGLRLTIDDFGVEYSSLNHLKRFPVDNLKIDHSFVKEMTTRREDAAITRGIIALSHTLGIDTVAEGVETLAQLELLRRSGCDQIQGYLFSEPVSAASFEEMLRTGARLEEATLQLG